RRHVAEVRERDARDQLQPDERQVRRSAMKNLRWIVPALLLAVATPGCVMGSAQFLIDFNLDNFTTSTDSAVTREDVDLTTEGDYNDHKDDLKGLSDVAVLGKVTNNGASAIGVEVWMTP